MGGELEWQSIDGRGSVEGRKGRKEEGLNKGMCCRNRNPNSFSEAVLICFRTDVTISSGGVGFVDADVEEERRDAAGLDDAQGRMGAYGKIRTCCLCEKTGWKEGLRERQA